MRRRVLIAVLALLPWVFAAGDSVIAPDASAQVRPSPEPFSTFVLLAPAAVTPFSASDKVAVIQGGKVRQISASDFLLQLSSVSIFAGKVAPLGYCQLTSLSASTQLSACAGGIPAGATVADVIVQSQAIRYRTDGVAPTATVGMPLAVGSDKIFSLTNLTALRLIEQVSGAVANIEFF